MSAPNLETIKIRVCWGLRRLPAVSGNTTNKRPKVDCEKDWWDNLEWDGVEANHDPSLYEPSHSRYYKNAHLPRGTVLRARRGVRHPVLRRLRDDGRSVSSDARLLHAVQLVTSTVQNS